jgi:hypothetical protein
MKRLQLSAGLVIGAVLICSTVLAQVGTSSGGTSSSASPPSPSLGSGQGTTPVGASGGTIRDVGTSPGVFSPRILHGRRTPPRARVRPLRSDLGASIGARVSDTGAGTFGTGPVIRSGRGARP